MRPFGRQHCGDDDDVTTRCNELPRPLKAVDTSRLQCTIKALRILYTIFRTQMLCGSQRLGFVLPFGQQLWTQLRATNACNVYATSTTTTTTTTDYFVSIDIILWIKISVNYCQMIKKIADNVGGKKIINNTCWCGLHAVIALAPKTNGLHSFHFTKVNKNEQFWIGKKSYRNEFSRLKWLAKQRKCCKWRNAIDSSDTMEALRWMRWQ